MSGDDERPGLTDLIKTYRLRTEPGQVKISTGEATVPTIDKWAPVVVGDRRLRPGPAVAHATTAEPVWYESIPLSNIDLLIGAEIITFGAQVPNGALVEAVTIPWSVLVQEFCRDPQLLHKFHWRKMEELVAAAYKAAKFDEVILTPRSGDRGRDVIATRHGLFRIRILDQVKAYAAGNLVPADDVRAMVGVLSRDAGASKAYVTTTSDFEPGVYDEFRDMMPTRLELRTGADLIALFAEYAK